MGTAKHEHCQPQPLRLASLRSEPLRGLNAPRLQRLRRASSEAAVGGRSAAEARHQLPHPSWVDRVGGHAALLDCCADDASVG